MRNFQDTFQTRKRPIISGFSICMTVPINVCRGTLSCVNIISQGLYSKSKDDKILYLTSFKIAADFLNV